MRKDEKKIDPSTGANNQDPEELEGINEKKKKPGLGRRIANIAGIAVCAVIVFVLLAATGLFSGNGVENSAAAETVAMTDTAMGYDPEVEESALEYDEGGFSDESVNIDESMLSESTSRKLITTFSLDLETLHFDDSLDELISRTEKSGGYIESSYVYNGSDYSSYEKIRTASLTCRIPESVLDEFVEGISESFNITGMSKDVEDVTLTYVDLESRRSALETEEETLLSMMEKAESVEDIIAIEAQLTEVRYQLESIESQIRTYDNKINYSTVYIYLSEVAELTDTAEADSFADKISKGFANSIKNIKDGSVNLVLKIIVCIPYIILTVIAVVIILLIIHRIKRKKK